MKTTETLKLIRYTAPDGTEGSRLTRTFHETMRDLIEMGCKNIVCAKFTVNFSLCKVQPRDGKCKAHFP